MAIEYGDYERWARSVDQLLRRLGGTGAQHGFGTAPIWSPPTDVFEVGGGVVVKMELPGVSPEDLSIVLIDDKLVVKGQRRDADAGRKTHYLQMEIIHLPGYSEDQKVEIAKRHLLPRQIEGHGLMETDLDLTADALHGIVNGYTREAGVRNLEREIGSICRKTARKVVEGEAAPFRIEGDDLPEYLGPRRFFSEIAERTATPGVVTGLVWTPVGGDIIFIETTRMRGKQGFLITGSLGDVMKESAQAALSWVRANAESLGIDPEEFAKWDLHIHVPAGATPKDGPSAGVAIATSLASLFTGRPIQSTVAMMGEITLRGRVLPVGGVKEKVIGAHRAGIKTVILPERNEKDLEEIPESIRDELKFRFAGEVSEVIEIALCPECEPSGEIK